MPIVFRGDASFRSFNTSVPWAYAGIKRGTEEPRSPMTNASSRPGLWYA